VGLEESRWDFIPWVLRLGTTIENSFSAAGRVITDLLSQSRLSGGPPWLVESDGLGESLVTRSRQNAVSRTLEALSTAVTKWTGGTSAFALAVGVVLVWLISGPVFGYSDTWQLVINTGTTIVTFLMVFLIQRSQNKESMALQLKLNELVAAVEGASNRLIDVEDLSEEELKVLHKFYRNLTAMAKKDAKLTDSHSVEEAEAGHARKTKARRHAGKT
jgi:low affinity Fe/Cu permease